MKQRLIFIFLLLLLCGGCCGAGKKLVIISTNDIHSIIDNFPSLVTLAEEYRAEEGVSVLLIDAGDRWTGSPYVDMAPEQYKPVIELMNAAGFDIATFGNHEWDNGINLLAKRTAEAGFRKVLTNADMDGTPLEATEPFYITEIDGLRLGFIGLVTTDVDGHPDGKLENFGGIEFFDPFVTAEQYAGIADSVDLYITISHLGFTADSLLALQRPEIDIIIGGHSHTVIPVGKDISGTMVTQTGKNLIHAGVTEITHKKGKVKKIENRLVELAGIERHPETAAMVDAIKNDPFLQTARGEVTGDMDKIALLNLFSDAMRYETSAQFAFYNVGGMRISELAAGPVTRAEIYSAEPFGNTVVNVWMTMEEIASLIMNKFNSTGKESHGLDLYPSGMTYRIVTDDEGNGTDIFFDYEASPRPDRRFLVALSDYVAAVYHFDHTEPIYDFGERIAFRAEGYIYDNSPIVPDNTMRVIIE